jgi:DMSO/TMAO reductase YedYZ molybdopterin-dependent catalytic subunit
MKSNDLISRSEGIVNLEMPFSTLEEFVTPVEKFYVRCHFPVPQIGAAEWQLRVEGAVESPLQLTLDDLRALPQHTITATMECAGNGRSRLEPKVKGVSWDIGAVGNATWTGVLLRDVLASAGCRSDAVEVVLEGADRGEIKEPPRPPGEIHYARSVPIAKAQRDVLLAFEMNGAPLLPEHGFPLRAVVPGWFGMASVKWLQRVVVTQEPFTGYYQSIDYTYWERRDGMPTLLPLREMRVKAQIARPAVGETIPAGKPYIIRGAAWGGENELALVEVSTDGGSTWAAADLLGEAVSHAWRFWQFTWNVPAQAGAATLIARATDAAGRIQPPQRVQEYGTYMINHWLPVQVQIGARS